MHRTMNLDLNMSKPIFALVSSGGLWVANAVTETPHGFWLGIVKEIGLPSAMLGLAVYGLNNLSKQIREIQQARVQDQKDILAQYRQDMQRAEDSRERLIAATNEQTRAIKERS